MYRKKTYKTIFLYFVVVDIFPLLYHHEEEIETISMVAMNIELRILLFHIPRMKYIMNTCGTCVRAYGILYRHSTILLA